jgi:hypothetical protein
MHEEKLEKKGTESATFRLDGEMLAALKREAEQREISLNTFVNQIVRRFVQWDMHSAKAGMMQVPKPLLVDIIELLDEKQISHLANKHARDVMRTVVLFLKNRYDAPSFLTVFEDWMKVSSVAYRHTKESDFEVYVMQHELGLKWSQYFKVFVEKILESFNLKVLEFEVSEKTLSFRIETESKVRQY